MRSLWVLGGPKSRTGIFPREGRGILETHREAEKDNVNLETDTGMQHLHEPRMAGNHQK